MNVTGLSFTGVGQGLGKDVLRFSIRGENTLESAYGLLNSDPFSLLLPLPSPPLPSPPLPPLSSVHMRVSEKMTLVAGRDGGLQNMEVLGIIQLRISDSEFGKVVIAIDNHEDRNVLFQVCMAH